MKKRFSEEQIIGFLRGAESGVAIQAAPMLTDPALLRVPVLSLPIFKKKNTTPK